MRGLNEEKVFLSGSFCHFCTPHLLGKRSVDPLGEYLADADLERLNEVPGDQMIRRVFKLKICSQPIRERFQLEFLLETPKGKRNAKVVDISEEIK